MRTSRQSQQKFRVDESLFPSFNKPVELELYSFLWYDLVEL